MAIINKTKYKLIQVFYQLFLQTKKIKKFFKSNIKITLLLNQKITGKDLKCYNIKESEFEEVLDGLTDLLCEFNKSHLNIKLIKYILIKKIIKIVKFKRKRKKKQQKVMN